MRSHGWGYARWATCCITRRTPPPHADAPPVPPRAQVHVGQDVTCVGRVASTGVLPTRKGLRVFRAVLRDDRAAAGGVLECAWPGQPFLERQIKRSEEHTSELQTLASLVC